MKSLRHRLPSLTSLMVFEAAARTLNFTRAAEELHVSQAAVSKQIRYLEDYFGFELFQRHGRRVTLSSRGQQLLQKVSASFNYLADAVDELGTHTSVASVTLAANTAMSHYWLSAAINAFRDRYPAFGVNIRVITSDHTPDHFADDVNLAVVYDPSRRIGWSGELLFEEELYPVASPDYIRSHPLCGEGPEALLSHRLLDYERVEPNWINWPVWFESLGVNARGLKASGHGNNYTVLVDAAARGHGVTLGTRYLLDLELQSGRLARLSDFSVRSGRGYYLMLNNEQPYREEVGLIHQWLREFRVDAAEGG
ncbi:LysR substrate-binding domain-containing protein [Marinobacterium aestuariivivens]|uniref:LysR substrate-binding domain-containing protein n=1 Tax=Marinobacterium aestuariivivens TaxID=1698799 RepID=A0ABW2A103_9GAMM